MKQKARHSMSNKRKLQRQVARAKAAKLSNNGKNGKSSTIFKNIWKGQQVAAGKVQQRNREHRTDKDIARLIENARQRAAERVKE